MSLSLGEKCIVEILKQFQMMDNKPLTTPMIPNLRLHTDLESNLVDLSVYKELIGSLMYLVNPNPDIYFAMNTMSHFMF